MGILLKKQSEGGYILNTITKLSVVSLIVSLAFAYIDTIWAVYLDSFFENIAFVGFFSALLTFISFISHFLIVPAIEKANKPKVYALSLFIFLISCIFFAFNKNFYLFVIMALVITVVTTFRITSFGLLIRENSKDHDVARNEGLIYTLTNLAWVVGPLIAGFVAARFGNIAVFLIASLFLFIGLMVFISCHIKRKKVKGKVHNNFLNNFIDFFRSKKRLVCYILSGGVNCWWSFMYLFIPLFIIRSGLSELWVGYFLFGVALPLILCEYYFSEKAGKHGFKNLFKTGYLIVAILAVACFFMTNVYIILALLVFASFGMAMLEPTTEAYFFDILGKNEKYRFYSPYNTASDTGNFVARIFASCLLLFLPFKFLFLLFAGFMFLLFLLSHHIKDVFEYKK